MKQIYIHLCNKLFFVSIYTWILLLSLVHFKITPMNANNCIQTRVGLQVDVPNSYCHLYIFNLKLLQAGLFSFAQRHVV